MWICLRHLEWTHPTHKKRTPLQSLVNARSKHVITIRKFATLASWLLYDVASAGPYPLGVRCGGCDVFLREPVENEPFPVGMSVTTCHKAARQHHEQTAPANL
ncbi:hypothetical protein CCR75_007480 [Bremia lactucae]|uniref:Uncharacterized protein n=1 Tax=Bremia lactucae TaxID=4779 RepID=A0A976IEI4_BRELC|nr:hypothetical protein CCR75_007480 [Bremia lactucae]